MSAPLLSADDAVRANAQLGVCEYEAATPFEFAVVRLLMLIVWAITRRDP